MRTDSTIRKLEEAMAVINDAAGRKIRELSEAAEDSFESAKDVNSRFRRFGRKAVETSKESVRGLATTVDKKVHKSPWYFIGGAAATGIATGLLLKNLWK